MLQQEHTTELGFVFKKSGKPQCWVCHFCMICSQQTLGDDCYKATLHQLYLNLCICTAGTINTICCTWFLNQISFLYIWQIKIYSVEPLVLSSSTKQMESLFCSYGTTSVNLLLNGNTFCPLAPHFSLGLWVAEPFKQWNSTVAAWESKPTQ